MPPLLPPLSAGPSRDAFARGARLFDAGEFFQAHEAWEERWRVERDPSVRRAFQGFIQIAAGYHKLFVMKNPASAARLLAKGVAKLEAESFFPSAPDPPEGELHAPTPFLFLSAVRAHADALAHGGGGVDRATVPKIGV